ncbi:hypothetical protein B0A70_07350 [Chryseobacterium piscicola]|uniref:Uncharacterized protein n=1 Tax=Chryseobacterium piscicola TaxID=551459 RepID=A0A2S7KFM9_9FLAO|nr:hypothetical protein B0A70_07350 [Chryseobacterium piscicola]
MSVKDSNLSIQDSFVSVKDLISIVEDWFLSVENWFLNAQDSNSNIKDAFFTSEVSIINIVAKFLKLLDNGYERYARTSNKKQIQATPEYKISAGASVSLVHINQP